MILTSPRLRAQLTGDLAGLPEERTWDALSEWDYGDYEGLTTPEIRATVPDLTSGRTRAPAASRPIRSTPAPTWCCRWCVRNYPNAT